MEGEEAEEGGGGAEWRRECLQLPGAEAERRRERKKKDPPATVQQLT